MRQAKTGGIMVRRVGVGKLRKGDRVVDPNGNIVEVDRVSPSLTEHKGQTKLTSTVNGTQVQEGETNNKQRYSRVEASGESWIKLN
jgi:hypothetical protein